MNAINLMKSVLFDDMQTDMVFYILLQELLILDLEKTVIDW